MPVSSKDVLLFLLSSVLVSSEAIHQRRQRNNKSKDEDLVEIVAAGSVESEGGRFGVAPSIEPLQNKWTLYFEKKSKERTTKCLNKTDYLKELTRVGSFQTIRSFWACWNEVQEECSISKAGRDANYLMFKENIKPIWEDPKNAKGGKWTVVLPASLTEEETVKSWMSLALTLLLGEWGVESEINGAVLSVRPWGSMLCVWNRNANDKKLIDDVATKLKEMFGVTNVKYQRHQATMRRNHAERAKMTKPKRGNRSSDDSSSSNSDASSSDGEERIMKPRRFSVNSATRGVLRELIEKTNEVVPEDSKKDQIPTDSPVSNNEIIQERPEEVKRKQRSRKSSTSSNEGAEVTNVASIPVAEVIIPSAKPTSAKRFPLPEVNGLYIGLATAVTIIGGVLSWATYYC